jgi:hypothetical protein
MGRTRSAHGEKTENIVLVGKPEGKKLLEIKRPRW